MEVRETSKIELSTIQKEAIPESPGIYIFIAADNKVLYVGKAKNIRNRFTYYLKSPQSIKTQSLLNKAYYVQFFITRNEEEAFLLEAQLIKKFRPPYNVVLRDDKNYPALKINFNDSFPRLEIVRRIKKDGSLYFGPYVSASKLKEAVKYLRKAFPIRSCNNKSLPKRDRPCINHDLGLCLAPCCGLVDKDTYKKITTDLIRFLNGDVERVMEELNREMHRASELLEFEKAAAVRDRIKAIDAIVNRQHMVTSKFMNQDFIGIWNQDGMLYISIVFVRHGAVTGQKTFDFSNAGGELPEIISYFLRHYYKGSGFIPEEIILNVDFEDRDVVEKWLHHQCNRRVKIVTHPRGFRKELVLMACNNAREHAVASLKSSKLSDKIAQKLGELAGLDKIPRYVGCIDISTMQGHFSVGVLVVFRDGQPVPSMYRSYSIDDSIASSGDTEMVAYTIRKLDEEDPEILKTLDILIIDGGKAQLNAALKALEHSPVSLMAIAKERTGGLKSCRMNLEKLYLPGSKKPIRFNGSSDILKLVQRFRDEAHRFAINNYRLLHRKSLKESILDEIPGIGPRRKQLLLSHFGDIEAIKRAEIEEIMAVPGIPPSIAKRVYDFFNSFKR